MKVNIINYHDTTKTGLISININDKINNFDNVYITDNNKLIHIYDYLKTKDIYTISKTNVLYNECDTNGLYIVVPGYNNGKNIVILYRINNDESELISNIDSNSNYIITNTCKLYKAGKLINDIYYCYECGKHIWK